MMKIQRIISKGSKVIATEVQVNAFEKEKNVMIFQNVFMRCHLIPPIIIVLRIASQVPTVEAEAEVARKALETKKNVMIFPNFLMKCHFTPSTKRFLIIA